MPQPVASTGQSAGQEKYILWIDGVGAYLVCLGERVTIGGPAVEGESADVALLANLCRRHVTLVRGHEGYVVEAHGPTKVAGRPVHELAHLNDGYELELGSGVRLRFRLPTVLSGTAVVEFLSGHRPMYSVDGILLMADNCLLGPGRGNHVDCPDWSEAIVLFRRDGRFWCKSRSNLFIDGDLSRAGGPIEPGSVVSGDDFRFRLEAVG